MLDSAVSAYASHIHTAPDVMLRAPKVSAATFTVRVCVCACPNLFLHVHCESVCACPNLFLQGFYHPKHHTLSHTQRETHTHSRTHALTHTRTHAPTHPPTHTHTHTCIRTLHSLPRYLDMCRQISFGIHFQRKPMLTNHPPPPPSILLLSLSSCF